MVLVMVPPEPSVVPVPVTSKAAAGARVFEKDAVRRAVTETLWNVTPLAPMVAEAKMTAVPVVVFDGVGAGDVHRAAVQGGEGIVSLGIEVETAVKLIEPLLPSRRMPSPVSTMLPLRPPYRLRGPEPGRRGSSSCGWCRRR